MKALFVFIVSCLIFCQSDTKYYEIDKSIERDLTLHKNKDSNCKYSSGTIGYFMYSGLQVKKSLEGLEDRIKLLHHQIKKLNIIEKGIVLLYLEGKSYDTIAEITGFTKTNVGTRLSRIKEKLNWNLQKKNLKKGFNFNCFNNFFKNKYLQTHYYSRHICFGFSVCW